MKIEIETIQNILAGDFEKIPEEFFKPIKTKKDITLFTAGVFTGTLMQSVILEYMAHESEKTFIQELSDLIAESIPKTLPLINHLQNVLHEKTKKDSAAPNEMEVNNE